MSSIAEYERVDKEIQNEDDLESVDSEEPMEEDISDPIDSEMEEILIK